MDLYFWGGIIIAALSFIIGLIWFCYRAGRNAARVQSGCGRETQLSIWQGRPSWRRLWLPF
ncbi:hypothetical protein [Bombella apis]|uniref:hypothetical protein n=1 Tax=Bombella apis TaxID=1785988 RepID=UPI0012B85FA0|nr:hypothetical protein [Bombella apis]MPW00407.1 hypothetical protein [Bombella apis]